MVAGVRFIRDFLRLLRGGRSLGKRGVIVGCRKGEEIGGEIGSIVGSVVLQGSGKDRRRGGSVTGSRWQEGEERGVLWQSVVGCEMGAEMRERAAVVAGCHGLMRGRLPSASSVRRNASQVEGMGAAAFLCLRDVFHFRISWLRYFYASGAWSV